MATTILNALLPVVVTLLLGVVAAWHHDFDEDQATVLNRMVMTYALPLMLFSGIVATPRSALAGDIRLISVTVGALLGGYFVTLLLARYVFRRNIMTATLQALAIGVPSIGFVGLPVLGYLFGENAAAIPVAVSVLAFVLVQLPLSLVLLSAGAAARGDGGTPKPVREQIVSALIQPVVWAPVIAFVIMLLAVPIPSELTTSLALLGHATSGVALFASGVILFSRRVKFSVPMAVSVVARNIVIPACVWGLVVLFDLSKVGGNEAVVTMAIPTAVICLVFAVQYRVGEQEMASTLLVSTLLSLPTMGVFIWLLGA